MYFTQLDDTSLHCRTKEGPEKFISDDRNLTHRLQVPYRILFPAGPGLSPCLNCTFLPP